MDITYLLFLQELREKLYPTVEIFMGIVSAIDVHFMVILIPALFYWCLNKKNGEFIFFTYCFGDFLNGVLKLSVCCYRPWIRDPRIVPSKYAVAHATGYSFPSGHSVNAGTIFVSTGWKLKNQYNRVITVIFFIFAGLVMFSRNYLGVHTPQDVIAGMLLGIFTIWFTKKFFVWVKDNQKNNMISVIIILSVILFSIIYFKYKPYPMDYVGGKLLVDPKKMMNDAFVGAGRLAGLIIGWILEKKFINFTNKCSKLEKIIRFTIGLTIIVAINCWLIPLILNVFIDGSGKFLKGFIQIFVAVFAVPCLFMPISKLNHLVKQTLLKMNRNNRFI